MGYDLRDEKGLQFWCNQTIIERRRAVAQENGVGYRVAQLVVATARPLGHGGARLSLSRHYSIQHIYALRARVCEPPSQGGEGRARASA